MNRSLPWSTPAGTLRGTERGPTRNPLHNLEGRVDAVPVDALAFLAQLGEAHEAAVVEGG